MASTHPRRSTKTTSSAMTLTSNDAINALSLRKGSTFHTPPTTSSKDALTTPCLPRRSQTMLEDAIDAHQRRVALTLGDIDRGLCVADPNAPSNSQSTSRFRDDSIPVPHSILKHNVMSPSTEYTVGGRSLRPRRQPSRVNHPASDSGLGSSIQDDNGVGKAMFASAMTRSDSTTETLPRLSQRATNKIHEFILKPLLATPSLKDFYPILEDCPRRIQDKEIVCLRDLEKTLVFLAPERSKTAKMYLDFCLTSIRCIQATVDFLNDQEQTRPQDRPYTNGYFIDLVDQIRSYAQSVQASKAKKAKGETLDEMDAESSDEVKLYGGIGKSGRPAELVHVKKNGKAFSVSTGQPIKMESIEEDEKGGVMMKRSLSEQEADDESVMRSMARRKRSASAAELAPKRCSQPGCTKEFKRSCDLTKHEKTHSRPWKCDESTCKYHEYGWPTEKELHRHVNDKHSSSPVLYMCEFAPCPYQSKRESNCKQHMEKSHNWKYIRSKNNGKNREKTTGSSLPTPQTTNIPTPDSSSIHGSIQGLNTPEDDGHDDYEMETSYTGPIGFDHTMYEDNILFPEFPNHGLLYDNLLQHPFQASSDSSSAHTSPFVGNTNYIMDDVQANFGQNSGTANDFMLFEQEDLYNARVEIPAQLYQQQECYSAVSMNFDPVHHMSPGGHGNPMFYTPPSSAEVDDTFDHFNCDGLDFQLYSNNVQQPGLSNQSHTDIFVDNNPSAMSGFSQPNSQEFFKSFYANTNTSYDEGFGYGDHQ